VKEYQSGQILLMVVLVMVVVLTVGLSVATRSITNLRTTTEQESSERAFSAAEAGIERALVNNLGVTGSFSNNASYQTTISTLSGVEFLLNNGQLIGKDDAADIWLAQYPNYTNPWTGNLTLYWGLPADVCTASEASNSLAALQVVVLTGTKASSQITHYALDPCAPRRGTNNFELIPAAGGTAAGKTFRFRKTIAVTSGLVMRIIPLYSSTIIGVRGCDGAGNNCNALPAQGTVIESVGTSDKTQRKIVSFRSYPKLPTEFFPYALFSPQ